MATDISIAPDQVALTTSFGNWILMYKKAVFAYTDEARIKASGNKVLTVKQNGNVIYSSPFLNLNSYVDKSVAQQFIEYVKQHNSKTITEEKEIQEQQIEDNQEEENPTVGGKKKNTRRRIQ